MSAQAYRTSTSELRRKDLIRGSISSISKFGFHNSTVKTICKEAGMSRGLIGHYFAGKEDLLLAAFEHLTERLGKQTVLTLHKVTRDPFKRLVALATMTFHPEVVSCKHAPVWLAFWGVALWEPEMLEVHRDLWGKYRDWIERLIGQAAAERGLELDVRIATLTFTQLLDGLFLGWVMEDSYTLEDCQTVLHKWLFDTFEEAPDQHRDVTRVAFQIDSEEI